MANNLSSESAQEQSALVTVFATGNAGLIAVAKSILEDAGIPNFAKGEGLQNLFGIGVVGTGFNPVVGPVQIQVPRDCEEDAKGLLEGLEVDHSNSASKYMRLYIVVGISIGVAIGVAMGDNGWGVVAGAALGVLIVGALRIKKRTLRANIW